MKRRCTIRASSGSPIWLRQRYVAFSPQGLRRWRGAPAGEHAAETKQPNQDRIDPESFPPFALSLSKGEPKWQPSFFLAAHCSIRSVHGSTGSPLMIAHILRVIPAHAGIQAKSLEKSRKPKRSLAAFLDSRVRGNDMKRRGIMASRKRCEQS
jgi:hypothetical protein